MVTNSIVTICEEDFAKVSGVIERAEKELGLQDIALLEDYLNILFDSTRESTEKIMDMLRKEHPAISWRIMMSEGEKICSVYIYDGEKLTIEDIDKTMDEISQDVQFSCSGNCAKCSSDCGHEHKHKHGEGCDCEECHAQDFSIDETEEMFCDMIQSGDNEFFGVLINAFREEMERFTQEQSGDDADEAYDIFMNNIAQIMISCAACDGSYTETEHSLINMIFGDMSYDRLKCFIQNMRYDDEDTVSAMRYWHEAEQYGCEIRRYILMMCTYICCIDGELNDKERDCLEMLVGA